MMFWPRAVSGALFLLCCALRPAEAGSPRFGDGFGVNVKDERMTPAEADKIAALGIKRVRIGVSWAEVEQERGVYSWRKIIPGWWRENDPQDWPNFTYDGLIKILRDRGLHIDLTLMMGNALYTGAPVAVKDAEEDGGETKLDPAPRTPDAIRAFAAFAAATAKHYSDLYGADSFTWEIWNEPDGDGGFPPHPDAAVFGDLLAQSCMAIKQAVPAAEVMGPSLSAYGEGSLRHEFIRGMFKRANPLQCIDAFTIHPYRPFAPETAPDDYRQVRRTLLPWQPAKHVPVAVDEWGYSNFRPKEISHSERWRVFSGEEQAALALRLYLTNLAAHVPLTILYEWRDSGRNRREYEHNFGMTDYAGNDKPGMRMMRFVWPELNGRELHVVLQGRGCSLHEHFHLFGPRPGAASPVLVAWTDDKDVEAGIAGAQTAKTLFGDPAPMRKTASGGRIGLSGEPVLVNLNNGKTPLPYCIK